MRFALVGDHPDGIELASALIESGRHQVAACTTALPPHEAPRRESNHPDAIELPSAFELGRPPAPRPSLWDRTRRVSDLEEVLADPAIEAVIVAGAPSVRPAQLRRALQSERHVLCVHPADQSPEIAYEAALLQQDTGCVLLPILPEALHPALRRLREFMVRPGAASAIGAFRLLEVERTSLIEVPDDVGASGHNPSLPGWDVLAALGGEVAEVSAFAEEEEVVAAAPLLISGRFERGGLFSLTLVPAERAPHWRFTVVGTAGRAEVLFPLGWHGPAFLDWKGSRGEEQEEHWEAWSPWPALVEAFESALDARKGSMLSWQDEVRALELDDAARRSVQRRRSNVLEHQEVSEEVGFKGTMTLLGCALLWGVLLLLIASRWVPQIGWAILPLLLLFAALQLLRFLIPARPEAPARDDGPEANG